MHCLWTLPQGDADFPSRWRAIKTAFVKLFAYRRVTITGDDQPRRAGHLAASVLGAHDTRRSGLCGSHGLHAFQPGETRSRRAPGGLAAFVGAMQAWRQAEGYAATGGWGIQRRWWRRNALRFSALRLLPFTNVRHPIELYSPPASSRRCGRIRGRKGCWGTGPSTAVCIW
jgi:hypothetical protein